MSGNHCALALAASVVLLAAPALPAQQALQGPAFKYDYFEGYYVNTDLDDHGIELAASVAVHPALRLFAGYLEQGYDNGLERTTVQLGATWRRALSNRLDLLLDAAIAGTEFARRGETLVDDDGLALGAGLRAWAGTRLELNGGIRLDGSAGGGADASAEFGGQYHYNMQMSIGARVRTDEAGTALFLGLRYFFR